MLLIFLSHIAMEWGLGSFQHSIIQALAALSMWWRTNFFFSFYVLRGICKPWSRKRAGCSGIRKSVNCWVIFCTSDQYCFFLFLGKTRKYKAESPVPPIISRNDLKFPKSIWTKPITDTNVWYQCVVSWIHIHMEASGQGVWYLHVGPVWRSFQDLSPIY